MTFVMSLTTVTVIEPASLLPLGRRTRVYEGGFPLPVDATAEAEAVAGHPLRPVSYVTAQNVVVRRSSGFVFGALMVFWALSQPTVTTPEASRGDGSTVHGAPAT
jgi:hypothetical protein